MCLRNVLFIFLLIPALAFAQNDLIKKQSPHSVQQTMDKLESLVKEKGLTVFARIDHKANAASVGKAMPDSQVLIFGNPKAGTRIMLNDLAAAVDLPLRVLVYADFDNNTWVLYHNPQGLKNQFSLDECKVLGNVEKALDNLSNAIIK
jgi:uncharacterized protein (DUF302 family)